MNRGVLSDSFRPGQSAKDCILTPCGKFQFVRMPFGLRNAPASFQRCMDRALGHLLGSTSTSIDDVLVFSNSWEEHLVHVRQVLEALAEIGLTAKPTKSVWGARSLSYLGHMIEAGYTSVPEARIKAIKQYH